MKKKRICSFYEERKCRFDLIKECLIGGKGIRALTRIGVRVSSALTRGLPRIRDNVFSTLVLDRTALNRTNFKVLTRIKDPEVKTQIKIQALGTKTQALIRTLDQTLVKILPDSSGEIQITHFLTKILHKAKVPELKALKLEPRIRKRITGKDRLRCRKSNLTT